MNLVKFSADLFVRIKAWIEPALVLIDQRNEDRAKAAGIEFEKRLSALRDMIPEPFDRRGFMDEIKDYFNDTDLDITQVETLVADHVAKASDQLKGLVDNVVQAIPEPIDTEAFKAEIVLQVDELIESQADPVTHDQLEAVLLEQAIEVDKLIDAAISKLIIPKPLDTEAFKTEIMLQVAELKLDETDLITQTDLESALLDQAHTTTDLITNAIEHLEVPANGIDGRDGLDIEILPSIDLEKSYPRGSYSTHNGGLWKAHAQTNGMRGWDCVVKGIPSFDIEQIDERNFQLSFTDTMGDVETSELSIPVMIYRGTYSPGTYKNGDTVTWGGSLWHCDRETDTKPGQSEDWTLCAKKGRDGKSG